MNITFIGGGNMACALIGGLLRKNCSSVQIRVVEVSAEARQKIKHEFQVEALAELAQGVESSNVIVLAVKPQQLSAVSRAVAPLLTNQLVISIAAGIQTTDISRWLDGYVHVVRAMPNTPALIRAGVTGIYAMGGVTDEEKHVAEAILSAVGTVLWVSNEELLHAVTAVSGSGPAYVFYFMEAIQKAARELGLDAAQARRLSIETFLGAARLADESEEDAALLRARVTSPGGTTERAIGSMDDADVGNAVRHAVHASNLRSREMSLEFGKT